MNKIIGNPTTTPVAIPDWNQTDPTKADYIKNKPDISSINGLKYYGDANIVPTDASLLKYDVSPFNDEELIEVSGLTDASITDVVIPYEIDGFKVGTVKLFDSTETSKLKSVTIPNGVFECGISSFGDLQTITMPDSIINLGYVHYCPNLTSIVIPRGVTTIDDMIFNGCTSLQTVVIHDGVTTISDTAFLSCRNITIICNAGSYAEQYAIENGIAYKSKAIYVDDIIAALPIYDGEVVEV